MGVGGKRNKVPALVLTDLQGAGGGMGQVGRVRNTGKGVPEEIKQIIFPCLAQ